MACTVESIRAQLTPEQNAKYKDYRIERWIVHKKGDKAAVLKTIGNQHINEDRVKTIMALKARRQATVNELNRNVMNIIHIAPKHQVLVYINTRNQAAQFDEQEAGDALLMFMYYVQHRIEELEGEGHTAIPVVDMTEAPSPKINEMEQQIRMFSGIMGRSFPGLFQQIVLVCNWGRLARHTVCALARGTGQNATLVSPSELMVRFGREFTPTVVGGGYDLNASKPISALVVEYVETVMLRSLTGQPSDGDVGAQGPGSWSWIMSRKFHMERRAAKSTGPIDRYAGYAAIGGAVLAVLMGQYFAILVIGAAAAYVAFSRRGGSGEGEGQERMLTYVLQTNYEECAALISSVDGVDLQALDTGDTRKLERAAVALSAGLTPDEKQQLKRCLKTVLDVSTMAELGPNSRGFYDQWVPLYQYLARITTMQVRTEHGTGDMDWLDAQFGGGADTPRLSFSVSESAPDTPSSNRHHLRNRLHRGSGDAGRPGKHTQSEPEMGSGQVPGEEPVRHAYSGPTYRRQSTETRLAAPVGENAKVPHSPLKRVWKDGQWQRIASTETYEYYRKKGHDIWHGTS